MKITPFQAIVLALFALSALAGVIVLATYKGNRSQGSGVAVVIWGVIPASDFEATVSDLTQGSNGLEITYVEKRSESFDQDLLEALASGLGPDVIILPHNLIIRHSDKLLPVPYETFPLRDFRDTFIQEGELYLSNEGILGVPFSVDPLVMYWNRDLLANAGIARPPSTWDEFLVLAPKLTVKDQTLNVLRSAVALGEFRNITNAKEIVSAFIMQAGNPILGGAAGSGGAYVSLAPATLGTVGAVNFYTDFANPVKPSYSWNRALPNSRDYFAAGNLAFYFGFASEVSKIRDKNPNLNFDLSYFPQPKGANVQITYGKMFALAILKNSRNSADALNAVLSITSSPVLAKWSSVTGLPPVRRDLLSASPADPYQSIFYNSAIRARGWLEPNPLSSSAIFQNMIESITGGEDEVGKAIEKAGKELNTSLRK